MKKPFARRAASLATVLAAAALLFAGCSAQTASSSAASSASSESSSSASSAASSSGQKTKVVVATGGMPKPFSYVDSNNQIEGYDIDVVRAVFSALPQYDLSIQKTEFTSIFAGLDSDRFQMGANNFAMNAQRKEKYYYSDPIFHNQFVIAVASNNNSIKSFADLLGKTTEVQAGVNYTTALLAYNEQHKDNPVKITYSQADMNAVLQHVESGKFDFQLIDGPMAGIYIKEYGLKLKLIPLSNEDTERIGQPYSYFILSKGKLGPQLLKDVNTALAEKIKDGTVTKISEKYFGADYAPKAAA